MISKQKKEEQYASLNLHTTKRNALSKLLYSFETESILSSSLEIELIDIGCSEILMQMQKTSKADFVIIMRQAIEKEEIFIGNIFQEIQGATNEKQI